MNKKLSPQIFFNSLKDGYGNIACENERIFNLHERLITFLQKNNLSGTPESQSVYRIHMLSNLFRFSGHVTGYKKLLEKFGYDHPEFYPDLNTHINCLAINSFSFKELDICCQKMAEELINNMYEWLQIMKIAFNTELLQMIGERKLSKDNYYIAESLCGIDYNDLYIKTNNLLPEYMTILNFPEKRKERLILVEKLEEKMYEVELEKLSKLNVI